MDECAICLEDLYNNIKLDCGHEFHLNCITKIHNNLCPLCRSSFILKLENLPIYFTLSISNKDKFNDFIIKHKNLEMNWYIISDIFPIEFILNNIEKDWNWYLITQKIPIKIILKNPKFNWNWNYLSHNVPEKIIKENIYLPWNVNILRKCRNLNLPRFIYFLCNFKFNF